MFLKNTEIKITNLYSNTHLEIHKKKREKYEH